MLIIGITQEPSTREYYLVFYHGIRLILDKIMKYYGSLLVYFEYDDFSELKEIGSGSYKTVYTAKCRRPNQTVETVVLKRFKNFAQTLELFISEVNFLFLIY